MVNVKATCGAAAAGALVPMRREGFIRESAKLLDRSATEAEIESALKTLTRGDNK